MKKELLYSDAIFGTHTISEPVLIDLINAPSIQRLHDIDQVGYPDPFFPKVKKHSRFEHSLGVFLLLKSYGSSLEEQIAGLIHDVSHTAFSHCADYTLAGSDGGKTQTHQDSTFERFVRTSEIPKIIARYGLDIDLILDDRCFPLKEQPLPHLCADRIDYCLRSALATSALNPQQIQTLLQGLSHNNRDWFFTDLHLAKEFAELFSHLNASFWCCINAAAMFKAVGECLRFALKEGYLTHEDIYSTDHLVVEKIEKQVRKDPQLKMFFERMNGTIPYLKDPVQGEPAVYCKSRVVDPLCCHDEQLRPLSELYPPWRLRVEEESKPRSFFLTFGIT